MQLAQQQAREEKLQSELEQALQRGWSQVICCALHIKSRHQAQRLCEQRVSIINDIEVAC